MVKIKKLGSVQEEKKEQYAMRKQAAAQKGKPVQTGQKGRSKNEVSEKIVTVKATKKDVEDLVQQGRGHLAKGEYSKALPPLQAAARFVPKHAKIWYYLATAYYSLNDVKAAYKCCRQVLRLDEKNLDAYDLIAKMLIKARNWEKAKAALKLVIQLNPQKAEAYYNLGLVYKQQGNAELSMRYLDLAKKKGSLKK